MSLEKPNFAPRAEQEKIDKNEKYRRILTGFIRDGVTKDVNLEYGGEILTEDGLINLNEYHKNNPEEIERQGEFVNDREKEWSALYPAYTDVSKASPDFVKDEDKKVGNRRGYFEQKYGQEFENKFNRKMDINSPEDVDFMFDKFIEERNKTKSSLLELAVTNLFHKALKGKFFMVRSSKYDDYKNGVDNLLIERDTGTVIGALDDIHSTKDRELAVKSSKTLKQIKKGGTVIQNGLVHENGSIKKKKLQNIPTLFVGMDNQELSNYLEMLSKPGFDNTEVTEFEAGIFNKMTTSLREQVNSILGDKSVRGAVRANLEKFAKSGATKLEGAEKEKL